jgi:hypothetical protein
MSDALNALLMGLAEIKALQRANPSPRQGSGLKKPDVVRAIGRSEVVLLSSHFERYIYGLNEEAVHVLCDSKIPVAVLREMLKLQYTKQAIDEIAATGWEKRASALVRYSATESLLWSPQSQLVELDASRILTWVKAPDPKSRACVPTVGNRRCLQCDYANSSKPRSTKAKVRRAC